MESLTSVRQLNAAGRFAEALKALEGTSIDRRDRLAADSTPLSECHSRLGDGRRRSRKQRAPGHADGNGRRRDRALHAPLEI